MTLEARTPAEFRLVDYLEFCSSKYGDMQYLMEREGRLRLCAAVWPVNQLDLVFAIEINELGGVDNEMLVTTTEGIIK